MATYEARLQDDYLALLKEASKYYMARGDVFTTLQNLTRRLEDEKIPYVLIGGLALAAHGFVRMTQDVDLLMRREGLEAFKQRFLGRGYILASSGAQKTFRDTETQVRIKILIAGDYPGDGKPEPIAFPDPSIVFTERGGMRVIPMETLIELKLASGMSAPHRLRDLADVQDLISTLKLPIELAERLDASVRETFRQLWHSAQADSADDSD
ncbi:MAG: nucleotidyltransferase family protein [Chloroflexota bacterium]|nr:nucleotidyltransferase family protein [Chloroflexota bacterium]